MDIKEISNRLMTELEKGTTILEVEECSITDTDRIYVSFYDNVDEHYNVKLDGFEMEDFALQQTEEYVKFILNNMGVNADVELDCELNESDTLWVFGDIVIN